MEESIRPLDLMQENERLHCEDVKRIIERRADFVEVPCPACESKNYKVTFEKDGFTFVSCKNCSTLFVNPRPKSELLFEFYSISQSIKHWNDKIFPASETARRINIFAPRAKRVEEIYRRFNGDRKGFLVDVGAGFGTFCEEVKKYDIFKRVLAVEPSGSLAETCRKKGLEVIEKPIEEVKLEGVDIITNFELIEHLFNPKEFIRACASSLTEDGLLIITTPNIKGFDLLVLGKISDNIVAPNHLNYFHPDSLLNLMQSCGFEVLEITTPGKLDAEIVRNKMLEGKFSSKCPFLNELLINRWDDIGGKFQQFLVDNKLSSHMWVVGRRK